MMYIKVNIDNKKYARLSRQDYLNRLFTGPVIDSMSDSVFCKLFKEEDKNEIYEKSFICCSLIGNSCC